MSRLIVVTGSASGIGAAVCALLRARGDRVIGVDVHDAEVVADLGTPEGRAAAVDSVLSLAGGVIDGVVTCAGVTVASPVLPQVNYYGTTSLVAGLRTALAGSDAPRVVLFGSVAGIHPVDEALVAALLADDAQEVLRLSELGVADGSSEKIYASSKSAIAQWGRRTAVSPGWADAGIAVNVIMPGIVITPMSAPLFEHPDTKSAADAAVPMPLHGYAQPEDLARVVGFLVSPELTHVTGQVIFVDGGAEATLRPSSVF